MSIQPAYHFAGRLCAGLIITLLLLPGAPLPAGAAAIYLQGRNNRPIEGTIDTEASDASTVVIRTANAVIKVPRAMLLRVEEAGAVAAGDAKTSASQNDQSQLKQYESDLAKDPGNPELLKKIDALRKSIQNRQRRNYLAYFQKIDALLGNQKFEEAVAEADGALQRVSDETARGELMRLKAVAHIKLGGMLHDQVNYTKEAENYQEAMKADPENPVAPLKLGDLLQQRSDNKARALTLFEGGLALANRHPGLVDANLLLDYEYKLGELYFGEKRYMEAGGQYIQVMQADKAMRYNQVDDKALEAFNRMPRASLDAPTRERIIAAAKTVLARTPRKQGAFVLLGHIYFDQQAWRNARDNLRLAVETASPSAADLTLQDALYSLAICQRKLHENEAAIASLEKLIRIKADHYDALCELGEILVEGSRLADAQQRYEQALAVDTAKPRAHLGRGIALQRGENYDEARKSFKDVLVRDKKNAAAQLAIARSYFEQKDYGNTSGESDRVLTMITDRYKGTDSQDTATSTSAGANANRATTATQGGTPAPVKKSPAADDDTLLLAKITPEDRQMMAEACTLIGKSNVLTQPAQTNVGRDNFNRALRYDPRYAPALEGIGMSWAVDKMNATAEDNFQKAIDVDPQNPTFYYSFALYWQRDCKKPEKALPLYLKYVALGGTNPEAADRIKECGGTVPAAAAKPPAPDAGGGAQSR